MVLSFQGGVYVAPGWAKGTFEPLDGVETDESGMVTLDGNKEETKIGCFNPYEIVADFNVTKPGTNRTTPAKGKSGAKHGSGHKKTTALARAIASTGIAQVSRGACWSYVSAEG
jgi:hypothetical protein